MIASGQPVSHPLHGPGVVSAVSPRGTYATVRYPLGYIRTHATRDLTILAADGAS